MKTSASTTAPHPVGTAMLFAATFSALVLSSSYSHSAPLQGTLNCDAHSEKGELNWKIELDDSLPLAMIDDEDTPAEYSSSHVRVLLSLNGPSMFIGRESGRLVLSAADGRMLARGVCTSGITT